MKASENNNNNWLDEALAKAIGSEKCVPNFEKWKQDHPQAVDMLTSRVRRKPSASPLKIRSMIMKSPLMKLAAAVIIAVIFAGIYLFGGPIRVTSVAWADIAERFESVPFFSLTIYIGHDTSDQAQKIEIWKSDKSKVRAHQGDKVIFADFADGKNEVVAFDRSTKRPVNTEGLASILLTDLCPEGQFSLDTLINSFPSDTKGIVPVETADTAASREMVVFEVKHKTTPEQLLIWALRRSKLPVQLRFRDPRSNEYGDFLFDYSEKKDATFFDPDAFKSQE
jgi:hypothetical protein